MRLAALVHSSSPPNNPLPNNPPPNNSPPTFPCCSSLLALNCPRRILLTGTPIQNGGQAVAQGGLLAFMWAEVQVMC